MMKKSEGKPKRLSVKKQAVKTGGGGKRPRRDVDRTRLRAIPRDVDRIRLREKPTDVARIRLREKPRDKPSTPD